MRAVAILVVLCLSLGLPSFLAGAAEGKGQSPPAEARSVEQLLQLIQDRQRTWEERRDCAEALAGHPDYDSPPILSLLKSQDAHVRMLGAIALRGGADKAVPELLRILQEDPNGTVQSFAATSLGRIGDRRAVPVLLRLADNENTHYRALQEIVWALGEIADPRATDILVRIVKDEINRTGNQVGPWSEALHGLRKLGNDKAVEALGEAATKRPNQSIGQIASTLLSEVDNPEGLERMGMLAIENRDLRVGVDAITGLGNFHSGRAVAILSKAYQQKPGGGILLSMGRTGHPDAIPILLGVVLDDEGTGVFQHEAANALALIGPSSVPSLLQGWAKVKDGSVRKYARRALLRAMSGIADIRLLPVWEDVFNMAAPEARISSWGLHVQPEWEVLLGSFCEGMLKLGRDALPRLGELYRQEPHGLLRKELFRVIEQISNRKSPDPAQ